GGAMLLELPRCRGQPWSAFAVCGSFPLRAVRACGTALVIGLAAGPAVIRRLAALKIAQAVRTNGPETHLIKSGTPTMGGVLILISISTATLMWADWTNHFVWVIVLVNFSF